VIDAIAAGEDRVGCVYGSWFECSRRSQNRAAESSRDWTQKATSTNLRAPMQLKKRCEREYEHRKSGEWLLAAAMRQRVRHTCSHGFRRIEFDPTKATNVQGSHRHGEQSLRRSSCDMREDELD